MSADGFRTVTLTRTGRGAYEAVNARGGRLALSTGDDDDSFTPVELLLTAIAGCSAVDVDFITVKRAESETFRVEATGEKVRDGDGNHLDDLRVRFAVTFPEGEGGDRAREMLPRAAAQSHDRLCTVSRTVELGTPVATRVE